MNDKSPALRWHRRLCLASIAAVFAPRRARSTSFSGLLALAFAAPAFAGGDLSPISVTSPATANEGATLTVNWTVTNSGDATISGTWTDKILLSADATTGDDLLIANVNISATLAPGESYSRTQSVVLPQGSVGVQRFVVQADTANVVAEDNETNNTRVDPTGTTVAPAFPDLVVTNLSVPASANSGDSITISYSIQNQGTLASSGRWDLVIASVDTTAGNADDRDMRSWVWQSDIIAPGETRSYSTTFRIPSYTASSVRMGVRVDIGNNINEGPSGESNNATLDDPMAVAPADISIAVATPANGYPSGPVSVTYTYSNSGLGSVYPQIDGNSQLSVSSRYYLSTDAVLGAGDIQIGSRGDQSDLFSSGSTPGLQPGETRAVTWSGTLSSSVPLGTYRLILANDYEDNCCGGPDNIFEAPGTEVELFVSEPFEIGSFQPDLVVTSVSAPATASSGDSITVNYSVTNQGPNANTGGRWDLVIASVDATAGNADDRDMRGWVWQSDIIAPGETRSYSTTFRIPSYTASSVRMGVRVDIGNNINEGPSGESNNATLDDPMAVAPADVVVVVTAPSSVTPGASLAIQYAYTNIGQGSVYPVLDGYSNLSVTTRFYLSTDAVLGTGDIELGSRNDAELLRASGGVPGLQPGETIATTATYTVPSSTPTGVYRVIVRIDNSDQCCGGGDAIFEAPGTDGEIFVSPSPLAGDLLVDALTVPGTIQVGQPATVNWTVRNGGIDALDGAWFDEVLLSSDNAVGNDISLGSFPRPNGLAGGAFYEQSRQITVPAAAGSGTYFFIVRADAGGQVEELSETNNARVAESTSSSSGVDLLVTAADAPSTITLGTPFTVTWTARNQGTAGASSWSDAVYLSSNATLDSNDQLVFTAPNASSLAPGAQYSTSASVTLPLSAPQGPRFLFVVTDASSAITELNDANNSSAALPVTAVEPPLPDLVARDVTVSATASAGGPIAISWTVDNTGEIATATEWSDAVRLLDAPGGNLIATLATHPSGSTLAAGASLARGVTANLPNIAGVYFVEVVADSANAVAEASGESNNTATSGTVVVVAADLVAVDAVAPSFIQKLVPVTVTWKTRNIGTGASFGGCWREDLVISTDEVLSAEDNVLSSQQDCVSPFAANATLNRTANFTLSPSLADGVYHLFVRVDALGARFESNETNNVLPVGTVVVTAPPTPNLAVTLVSVPSIATIGAPVDVTWTLSNARPTAIAAAVTWTDRVVFSRNAVFGDADDSTVGLITANGPFEANSTRTITRSFPVASPDGPFHVFVRTDDSNQVFEFDGESDNVSQPAASTANYPPRPDLVVTAIGAPATGTASQPISLSYTVSNNGEIPASGLWRDTVRATLVGSGTPPVTLGQFYRTNAIASGSSATYSESVLLPLALSGVVRLEVTTDSDAQLSEGAPAREANNWLIDDATIAVGEPPLVDLVIESVSIPASGTATETVAVSWTGRNIGEVASPASWIDRVYLSTDTILSADDALVGTRLHGGIVASKTSWSDSLTIQLPELATPRFAIVVADATDLVEEGSAEGNNSGASGGQISIAPAPRANLAPVITAMPSTWQSGASVQIGWRVANGGNATATGPWTDGLYLSTDAVLSADDLPLRLQQFSGSVATGAAYDRSAAVTLPTAYEGGTRFLLVRSDINSQISETNESDNIVASAPFELLPTPAPDLVPSALATNTSPLTFGSQATFTFTESNTGSAAASTVWTNLVTISTDATPSANDQPVALGGTGGSPIAAGGSVTRTVTGTIPLSNALPEGQYWFIVQSDANASVSEQRENNNATVLGPVLVSRPPLANLVAAVTGVPAEVGAGVSFAATVALTNDGAVATSATTYLAIFAVEPSGVSTLLQEFPVPGAVAAGETKSFERALAVPQLASSTFALRVCADHRDAVVESSESDNCGNSASVTIRRPNLVVTAVSGPSSATAGDTISVQYTVSNTGNGAASGFWGENIALSPDQTVGSDRLVGSNTVVTPLAPGASIVRNASFVIPAELEGNHSFVVVADATASLVETNESDNARLQGTIAVTASQRPNLTVLGVTMPPTVVVGQPFAINFTVRNAGDAPATANWIDSAFLSTNTTLGPDDLASGSAQRVSTLAPGATYSGTINAIAPVTAGVFRVIVRTDATNAVLEEPGIGENDNTDTSSGSIAVIDADVVVEALAAEVAYPNPMPIRVRTFAAGTNTPVGGIPLTLLTNLRGFPIIADVSTNASGVFTTNITPLPNQAGLYRFGAAVRGRSVTLTAETLSWGVAVSGLPSTQVIAGPATVSGTLTIRNLGDVAISGLALAASTTAPGLSVQSFLPDGSVLGPNETRVANYTITAANDASNGPVTFMVTTDRTAPVVRQVPVQVVLPQAALVATPAPVQRSMLVGETSYFSVTIRNLGSAPTGQLDVLLSNAPWLSLVSPASLAPLAPGAEASVDIRLSPAADLPLGPYSAAPFLVVRDPANSATTVSVNGVFNATSDAQSTLTIRARNEFSYYGVPPTFPNATVEVRRLGQSALVAGGQVDAGGNISFDDLESGLYDIRVSAPSHGQFAQTRLVEPGQSEIVAFLPRQLVNYHWSVVPIPFTDQYDITLNLTFETNVPAPVITCSPALIDFTEMTQEYEYRELRVTNHGLIAAEDMRMLVDNREDQEITVLDPELGRLLPGETRVVPILLRDRKLGGDGGVAGGGGGGGCGGPGLAVRWSLDCDIPRSFSLGVAVIGSRSSNCGPIPIPNMWAGVGGDLTPSGGIPNPSGGGPGSGPGTPIHPHISGSGGGSTQRCDDCGTRCGSEAALTLSKLVLEVFCPKCALVVGMVECAQSSFTLASSSFSWFNVSAAGIDCLGAAVPGLGETCDVIKTLNTCRCFLQPPGGSPPDDLLNFGAQVCGGAGDDSNFGPDDELIFPELSGDAPAVAALAASARRAYNFTLPIRYALGSSKLLYGATAEERVVQQEFLTAYFVATSEASPEGIRISDDESSALQTMPRAAAIQAGELTASVARWNRSLEYNAMGWFDAADLPDGFDPNFIERSRMMSFLALGIEAADDYLAMNIVHPIIDLQNAIENLQDEVSQGQGVCVTVGVELNQTATVVRQAFSATLTLDNATESVLEGIDVDIKITDIDGVDRGERFAVLGPEVTGMADVDGNGQLAAGAAGTAQWTLIPGDSAAANGPTAYRVSGQIRYASQGQIAVIPLFPVTITVFPNPSLSLQYFIETRVYSDDPFTPEIEPTVPFSLGLWAKNNGGGTAGSVTIESAQPVITSNETGALIDFQLIGAQVNDTPISPSLTVNMGDVLPGEVGVAQWLMISSIQGEFTGYSATVRSTNGFNDPEFSIVDEAAVNAMTHVVRADVPLDDGRPDFLGNLTADPMDLPDRVHLSSGAIEPVVAEITASVTVESDIAIIAATPSTAWKYIRIEDPFEGSRRIESVTRSDGKQLRLGDNAWQTAYISRDTAEPEARRFIHIFDRGGNGGYEVVFATDSESPRVERWLSMKPHGAAGDIGIELSSSEPAVEPRTGGVGELVLSFSEALDPATIDAVSVAVTAYDAAGAEVDVPVADRTLELRLGDQYATIRFPTPLPTRLRYCIRLVGVKDLAGNALDQSSASIDLILNPGDITGDGRVTVNDAGALGTLLGTTEIDPLNPFHVRGDLNRDGSITTGDAAIILASLGTDLRFAINPCSNFGASGATWNGDAPTGAGGAAGGPLAKDADGAGTRIAGASRPAADRGRFSGGQPLLVSAARGDDAEARALPPLDGMLAVRSLTLDEMEFAVMLAAYGLVEAVDAEAEDSKAEGSKAVDATTTRPTAEWRAVAVPQPLAADAALAALVELLTEQGVDCAMVVETEDGRRAAMIPEVRLQLRSGLPEDWADRMLETVLSKHASSFGISRVGNHAVLSLEPLFGRALAAVAATLARRSEIEALEVTLVGLDPMNADSGHPASTEADGQLGEVDESEKTP